MTINAGLQCKDYQAVLGAVKFLCERENSPDSWALLATVARRVDSAANLRTWLKRYLKRKPGEKYAEMMLGVNYFQTGFYPLAIQHFWALYRSNPNDPLLNLYVLSRNLGLSHLYTITSRTTLRKDVPFAKAFYFLRKYKSIRKALHPAEAYYNLGRAYHQVSYCHLADHYYRKILLMYGLELLRSQSNAETLLYAKRALRNLLVLYKSAEDAATEADLRSQYHSLLT